MGSKAQVLKRSRLTLNKQIAVAPTHAKKWEIALHGGNPPTAISTPCCSRAASRAKSFLPRPPGSPKCSGADASLIRHTDGKSRNFYCEQTIRELKVNGFEIRIFAEELGILCFAGLKAAALCYTTAQPFAKGQVYVFDKFNFHGMLHCLFSQG
jgi:hypothetical protein